MNRLDSSRQAQAVKCLCEGMSIRGTVRVTGAAKNTVVNLLRDVGMACAEFHDRNVRGLPVRRLQCDEIWSSPGAKAKNVAAEQKEQGWGDVWTWTAIDADTKLCVAYVIGGRNTGWARDFMLDCRERIVGNPQITTDAHKPYLKAVEEAFEGDADYAMLHKIYGSSAEPETHYSSAKCIGCDMKTENSVHTPAHVSTSFVERQNLTMRMSTRRFTQRTSAFSKRVESHAAAISLYFMYYNFCRVHQALRATPAMEAKLTDHVWGIEELVSLLNSS